MKISIMSHPLTLCLLNLTAKTVTQRLQCARVILLIFGARSADRERKQDSAKEGKRLEVSGFLCSLRLIFCTNILYILDVWTANWATAIGHRELS